MDRSSGADAPAVSEDEGARAVAEGAEEAVTPEPAAGAGSSDEAAPSAAAATVDPETAVGSEPIERPAPAVDWSAATPDRSSDDAGGDLLARRPELLVAGAFAAGLALALALRFASRG